MVEIFAGEQTIMRKLFAHALVFVALATMAQISALAAEWSPTRPIRVLVPFAPGGGGDLIARLVGPELADRLGQSVVIDNRPSAGGIVGTEMAAHAAPDGHTLLVALSNHIANPWFVAKLPYDAIKDFTPITLAVIAPMVMVVHPSLPAANLREFIAYTKAHPGKLNFGIAGAGGAPHLAGELVKSMAGVKMEHIVYKGLAPMINAVLGNEVQLTFGNIFVMQPHVRGGRLRALGITSLNRSEAAPDWPTIAESGLPGYEASDWYGFLAPARMPSQIVTRLNREITTIVRGPQVKQTIVTRGGEVVANTPDEFAKFLRDSMARLGRLVKEAGLKPE